MTDRLIYLDNAATSFPKPPEVLREMVETYARIGASPGRSSHDLAAQAEQLVERTRARLARFFGAPDPTRVVFARQRLGRAQHGHPGARPPRRPRRRDPPRPQLGAAPAPPPRRARDHHLRRSPRSTAAASSTRRGRRAPPADHAGGRHVPRLERAGHDPARGRDRPPLRRARRAAHRRCGPVGRPGPDRHDGARDRGARVHRPQGAVRPIGDRRAGAPAGPGRGDDAVRGHRHGLGQPGPQPGVPAPAGAGDPQPARRDRALARPRLRGAAGDRERSTTARWRSSPACATASPRTRR